MFIANGHENEFCRRVCRSLQIQPVTRSKHMTSTTVDRSYATHFRLNTPNLISHFSNPISRRAIRFQLNTRTFFEALDFKQKRRVQATWEGGRFVCTFAE